MHGNDVHEVFYLLGKLWNLLPLGQGGANIGENVLNL